MWPGKGVRVDVLPIPAPGDWRGVTHQLSPGVTDMKVQYQQLPSLCSCCRRHLCSTCSLKEMCSASPAGVKELYLCICGRHTHTHTQHQPKSQQQWETQPQSDLHSGSFPSITQNRWQRSHRRNSEAWLAQPHSPQSFTNEETAQAAFQVRNDGHIMNLHSPEGDQATRNNSSTRGQRDGDSTLHAAICVRS